MKYFLLISMLLLFSACSKQDKWLDIKSNKADVTPVTLADFQALLDNDGIMNSNYPALGVLGSDNYLLPTATWLTGAVYERNCYTWATDIFEGASSAAWNNPYRTVEYANIVLEGLEKIAQPGNPAAWNNAQGSALFYRAIAFYSLAALFAPPYDSASASSGLGIPIRTAADINQKSIRASVQQTYDRIIADLLQAAQLLPDLPSVKTRPSKAAAFGLLSRVYLHTRQYEKAVDAATKCLSLYDVLYNFNSLDAALLRPFPVFQNGNKEMIFYATSASYTYTIGNGPIVDSTLYKSYSGNDLRKGIFYRTNTNGTVTFKGSYTGLTASTLFSGLAVNEIYFNRAEGYARIGQATPALADLNSVLQTRFKTNTFVPFTASTAFGALQQILVERRKELPFTGNIRWEDLRRLNKEPAFAVSLSRLLNNQLYQLPPNHPKYVYPIPDIEIQLSGIVQNQR